MAKKKPAKDQHKSSFMVRLPEIYRTLLEKLKLKHRRTITAEVQIALDKHLQTEGMTPPTISGGHT